MSASTTNPGDPRSTSSICSNRWRGCRRCWRRRARCTRRSQLDELLNTVLRIVVRELELPGALITEPRMSYGAMPPEPWDGVPAFSACRTRMASCWPNWWLRRRRPARAFHLRTGFSGGLGAAGGGGAGKCALPRAQPGVDAGAAGPGSRAAHPAQPAAASRCRKLPGYSIAVRSSACYEVGGDYVDIVELPDGSADHGGGRCRGQRAGFGDCRHGFSLGFSRHGASRCPACGDCRRLNEQHYAEGVEARRRYVTAIFLRLEPKTNTSKW